MEIRKKKSQGLVTQTFKHKMRLLWDDPKAICRRHKTGPNRLAAGKSMCPKYLLIVMFETVQKR